MESKFAREFSLKMDAETVDELVASFEEKLKTIDLCLEFRNMPKLDAEKCQKKMEVITMELASVKSIFDATRDEITLAKNRFQELAASQSRAARLNAKMMYILNNLPTNLPKNEPKQKPSEEKCNDLKVKETKNDVKLPARSVSLHPTKIIMTVEPLEKKEFAAIPKYIKGRLTLETLNEAIADFNRAIEKKYNLLSKPLTKVGQFELVTYKLYKKQESEETKGVNFCSRDDLRKFPSYKFDNAAKTILSCLCHCRRVRYLYGVGTPLYAIV